jgi:hypothetical protein
MMNGSSGIQPTVELATTNGAYPYPVMFGNNGGFGNGFGGEGALWLIVLLALIWGGNGNNGFGGFGNNFDDGYAWLSNGQKEIMQNTNNGFDTLHLSNQLEGTRNALNDIQSQICNSTFSINDSIKDGFYGLNTSFLNCCCENKLGIADLKSTIISENCADRQALNEGIRDVIASQVAGTQKILDRICQDKIDEKNDEISQLRQEILYARGQASQIAQTQQITSNIYNELKNCPVGTVPVFGNQPIFTCSNNLGNGCGCTGTSQFI